MDTPLPSELAEFVLLVDALLAQLESSKANFTLDVDGEPVKLTNLDKPFWPAHGETPALPKRELIRYYVKLAPLLLPHLRDRPLTLTRYPNGVEAKPFYQKHYEQPLPRFRRDGPHLVRQQPAVRRLHPLQQPRDAGLARPASRPGATRMDVAHGPGAGRSRPRARLRDFGGDAGCVLVELPGLHGVRPRPVHLFRQGSEGRRAGIQQARMGEDGRGGTYR